MGRCPTLRTERLLLRPFVEEDLDGMVEVLNCPGVRESLHLPDVVTRDEAWSRMVAFVGQWELRGTGQWAVEEAATGRLLGQCGSHNPEREGWPGIEIGWTLHQDVWGRGFATEAALAARDRTFADHDVDALYSVILPSNVASENVAKRLGFTLWERREMAFFTDEGPFGIWRLTRDAWANGSD